MVIGIILLQARIVIVIVIVIVNCQLTIPRGVMAKMVYLLS